MLAQSPNSTLASPNHVVTFPYLPCTNSTSQFNTSRNFPFFNAEITKTVSNQISGNSFKFIFGFSERKRILKCIVVLTIQPNWRRDRIERNRAASTEGEFRSKVVLIAASFVIKTSTQAHILLHKNKPLNYFNIAPQTISMKLKKRRNWPICRSIHDVL